MRPQPSEIAIHPVLGQMYQGGLSIIYCKYFEAKHAYFDLARAATAENYHERRRLADAARKAEAAFIKRLHA